MREPQATSKTPQGSRTKKGTFDQTLIGVEYKMMPDADICHARFARIREIAVANQYDADVESPALIRAGVD